MISLKKEKQKSLLKREAALFSLGFIYDTELQIYLLEPLENPPIMISRDFVEDAPNDIFFREYCRFREILKKGD